MRREQQQYGKGYHLPTTTFLGISSDPASISPPGFSPKSDTTDEGRKVTITLASIVRIQTRVYVVKFIF